MLISFLKGAIKMRVKVLLRENKEVMGDNLELFSGNLMMVSNLLPSHITEKFKRNINALSSRLKRISNDTAFAKLFFDYFVLIQNFHSTIETFECSDLVDQKYEGYKLFKYL
jgi:hypothetical protein